jgi:hypothetical protein
LINLQKAVGPTLRCSGTAEAGKPCYHRRRRKNCRTRLRSFLTGAARDPINALTHTRPCQPHVGQRQFHCRKLPPWSAGGQLPIQARRRKAGSELGRQIPVDLQADADLNEGRGCPGHSSSSSTFPSDKQKSTLNQGAQPRKPGNNHAGESIDAAWSAR